MSMVNSLFVLRKKILKPLQEKYQRIG